MISDRSGSISRQTSIFVHMFSSSETSILLGPAGAQDDDIPEGVIPVGHFARDMDSRFLATTGNRSRMAKSARS